MKPLYLLLVTSVLVSYALAADKVNYRLSTLGKPSKYDVNLEIDPEKDTFTGTVVITLDITAPTQGADVKTLQLNAGYGYITKISKITLNNDLCTLQNINSVTDIATISCPNNIAGKGKVLTLEFTGKLVDDDMVGLYKTSYTENKETKTLAVTQFETSYARRAFPCFDEPSFKAIFTVTITAPQKYTVWGNTLIDKSAANEKDKTKTTTVFKPTPKMSSYLVAFIISEFESNPADISHADYKFSVISKASGKEYTSLAVKYGPPLIDLMGKWTGIKYSDLGNNKVDLAAIPDFAAGAMENWGLITYKEESLLDEKDKTSNFDRQKVIIVVAHELAHQWFGDYVTMNWWSEAWLNEGFAVYFEFYIANTVDKTLYLELDFQFVNLVHQTALTADSVAFALPLSSEDKDINIVPEQLKKFDIITYHKGGSIVRMMKYILGEEKFQQALKDYLTSNKNGNSKASILLAHFDKVLGQKTFSTYMNSWIYKPGFPILKASVNNDGKVTIENKKRFLLTGKGSSEWYVPITFTTSSSPNFDAINAQWLEPDSTNTYQLTNKDDWIIFNLQSSGFYRVNYDTELWSRIAKVLISEPSKIHVLNRALLLNDIFNIAKIGYVHYKTTFNLAQYIAEETEYYPWYSFLREVDYLLWKIQDDAIENQLIEKTLEWLSNAIQIPSSDSTRTLTHIEVLHRGLILKWACKLGHEGCINYAKTELESYKKTSDDKIDHNLRPLIFCYGLKYSTDQSKDFDILFNIYPTSKSPYEKDDVLTALGCATDKTILENYLKMSVATDSKIRLQDSTKVFRAVFTSGSDGLSIALEFMDKNMAAILDKYKGISAISGLLIQIAGYIVKEHDYNKLKKIIYDNPNVDEIAIVGTHALEIVHANVEWSITREEELSSALLDMTTTTTTPNSATGVGLTAILLCTSAFALFF